jgi:hypothetical protein
MANQFAKAASFGAAMLCILGANPAIALDWSGQISDVELASANVPPAVRFAVSSPFQFEGPGLAPQNIQVTALDTGVGSTTQAVVSLSLRLHVSYP